MLLCILSKGKVLAACAAGGRAGGVHSSALTAGRRQLSLDKAAAALQMLLAQKHVGCGLLQLDALPQQQAVDGRALATMRARHPFQFEEQRDTTMEAVTTFIRKLALTCMHVSVEGANTMQGPPVPLHAQHAEAKRRVARHQLQWRLSGMSD